MSTMATLRSITRAGGGVRDEVKGSVLRWEWAWSIGKGEGDRSAGVD